MRALLQDKKPAGPRVLDASRSEVRLKSGSLWRLLPVEGIFRQVTGNSTVSAAGDVTGTITWVRPLATAERRRPYEITAAGQEILAGQVTTMQQIVQVARLRTAMAWPSTARTWRGTSRT